MTLSDVLQALDEFSGEDTIYAECADGKWALHSAAVVTTEPDDENLTQVFDRIEMRYLLEVFLARDIVRVLRSYNGIVQPSLQQLLEAIVYYAEHDVYLPREALSAKTSASAP